MREVLEVDRVRRARLRVSEEPARSEMLRVVFDHPLEFAVALHERVIDRLVADLTASREEEFGEDFRVDFAPGDVVLHELEHPAERRVLRDDRAMVLAGQVQHAERVLHVLPEIAFSSEPQDGEAHSSGASSSFGSSAGPSVRASPSTAISSGSSPGGGPSATTGGASILRVKTCSAPALIFSRSVCSERTLTWPVWRNAANVASA